MAFFVRGRELPLRIEPAELARREPRLRSVRERLIRRAGGDAESVDRYLRERLGAAIARFADRYVVEQSARVDRMVTIRERLHEVYDAVIRGERPGPEAAQEASRLFAELETEMRGLLPPRRALEQTGQLDLPDISSRPAPRIAPTIEAARALGQSLDDVARLPAERQRAVLEATSLAPETVGRILRADHESALRNELGDLGRRLRGAGMSEADVARVLDDARELNRRRWERSTDPQAPAARARLAERLRQLADRRTMREAIAQRRADLERRAGEAEARGSGDYARELRRQVRRLDDWAHNEGGPENIGRRLRAAVEADPFLQDLAANVGGVGSLQRLFVEYDSLPRDRLFGDYVRSRMGEFRGLLGETAVGFTRGERFTFLKAPDERVTGRGTDLVAIDRAANNELLIIDNKAFGRTIVTAVSALTRNILRNLRDDVAAFERNYAGRADIPPELRAGVDRLRSALDAIEQDPLVRAAGDDPNRIAAPDVQRRIDQILRQHNVRRVVTGEGGVVDAVANDLRQIGIDVHR